MGFTHSVRSHAMAIPPLWKSGRGTAGWGGALSLASKAVERPPRPSHGLHIGLQGWIASPWLTRVTENSLTAKGKLIPPFLFNLYSTVNIWENHSVQSPRALLTHRCQTFFR